MILTRQEAVKAWSPVGAGVIFASLGAVGVARLVHFASDGSGSGGAYADR
jgi:hypothetical protein